jgi:hypothetical protein
MIKTVQTHNLMGIIAVSSALAMPCYATDIIHKTDRVALSHDVSARVSPQRLSPETAPKTDDFVVSAGGKVTPRIETKPVKLDTISGAIDAQSESPEDAFDNSSIYPILGAYPELHSDVPPKCGPSPLDPDRIKELVSATARQAGVNEQFALAIVEAESRNDQIRNSPKGARGPMQLIPATAARYHVKDICDPADNIAGGVAYLKDLTRTFQNPMLIAAAYNAGAQAVYTYGGIPPYRETVTYVARVMNLTMGLPMPEKSASPSGDPDAIASSTGENQPRSQSQGNSQSNTEAGVIETTKRGTFVAGVMQF